MLLSFIIVHFTMQGNVYMLEADVNSDIRYDVIKNTRRVLAVAVHLWVLPVPSEQANCEIDTMITIIHYSQ